MTIQILVSVVAALIAVNLVYFRVLRIAKVKEIVDNPNARKNQQTPVPILGGVAVFFGLVVGMLLAAALFGAGESVQISRLAPVLCAMIVMIFTGLLDDILGLSAKSRFAVELLAVLGMIFAGAGCVDSFHGLWGVEAFRWWAAVPLTVFAGVGIINAVNMIDGVNGLSSGLCLLYSVLFGVAFLSAGDQENAILAFTLAAALLPFLLHNVFGEKSRMFIGDAGTMMMGMAMVWFTISALRNGSALAVAAEAKQENLIAMTLAILSVPVFDAVRVMTQRAIQGRSPFSPDKNHLHHMFLRIGISNPGTALTEILLDAAIVGIWALSVRLGASLEWQLYLVILASLLLVWGVYILLCFQRKDRFRPATSHHSRWWMRLQRWMDAPEAKLGTKVVFVSGCYDLLHSGHVEFFRQAAEYGDLYVGIGSDATIQEYKHHKSIYPEQERLFMVNSIRYVKEAFINAGSGVMDFVPTVEALKPDVLVVNEDGSSEEKRRFCAERGIEYVVLSRDPHTGLAARSSTALKQTASLIPTRLDLAGTWIDQPFVSQFAPGWAITVSLEPTFEIRERCGLSTSTRNTIRKIWPYQLPNMDPEMLAKLVFCFENDPERSDGIISGAQDSIGICVPGLSRHYYDNRFWPERIETCNDEGVLRFLERHLVLIPMEPRRPGCSVVEGRDITEPKVRALAEAADRCWQAILDEDLRAFAKAYRDSFEAQVALFPAMIQGSVQRYIDEYRDKVLAWKMPGAGGGGYLACVVSDAESFLRKHKEAIRITIRRAGM